MKHYAGSPHILETPEGYLILVKIDPLEKRKELLKHIQDGKRARAYIEVEMD